MCAEYGANGLGRTMFTTVLTSDGALPVAPYLAFVIRHVDGTTVTNDYFTDGGVHLATYGWEKFRRIAENWMAYQV